MSSNPERNARGKILQHLIEAEKDYAQVKEIIAGKGYTTGNEGLVERVRVETLRSIAKDVEIDI